MTPHEDNRRQDRSAKRTGIVLLVVALLAIAGTIYLFVEYRRPPPPGGDLAPVMQQGNAATGSP